MTRFDQIEWEMQVSQENHTARFWDNVCSWAVDPPYSSKAVSAAENLAENCLETYQQLSQAVSTWNQFRDLYGGADKEQVYSAMTPVAEKLVALRDAGEALSAAVQAYHANISAMDFHGMKADYDNWATEFMVRYDAVQRDRDLEEEAFVQKHGVAYWAKRNELDEERNGREANGPVLMVDHLRGFRADLAQAVKAIDMEALTTLEFSHRPESLTQYGSEEELFQALRDSHVFGHLTDEELRQIAAETWGHFDDLPVDFVDANGVGWVFGPNGELVRSGSPMDPNVSALFLAVMANDPDLAGIELPFGEGTQTVAEFVAEQGLKGLKKLPDIGPVGSSVISAWAAAVVGLVGTGFDVRRYEDNLTLTSPLLTQDQVDDLVQKYANANLIMDGVDIGLAAGSAVLTAVFGPAGTVIGVVVTYVGSNVTEYIVTEAGEEHWTLDEMQDAYDPETGEFDLDD